MSRTSRLALVALSLAAVIDADSAPSSSDLSALLTSLQQQKPNVLQSANAPIGSASSGSNDLTDLSALVQKMQASNSAPPALSVPSLGLGSGSGLPSLTSGLPSFGSGLPSAQSMSAGMPSPLNPAGALPGLSALAGGAPSLSLPAASSLSNLIGMTGGSLPSLAAPSLPPLSLPALPANLASPFAGLPGLPSNANPLDISKLLSTLGSSSGVQLPKIPGLESLGLPSSQTNLMANSVDQINQLNTLLKKTPDALKASGSTATTAELEDLRTELAKAHTLMKDIETKYGNLPINSQIYLPDNTKATPSSSSFAPVLNTVDVASPVRKLPSDGDPTPTPEDIIAQITEQLRQITEQIRQSFAALSNGIVMQSSSINDLHRDTSQVKEDTVKDLTKQTSTSLLDVFTRAGSAGGNAAGSFLGTSGQGIVDSWKAYFNGFKDSVVNPTGNRQSSLRALEGVSAPLSQSDAAVLTALTNQPATSSADNKAVLTLNDPKTPLNTLNVFNPLTPSNSAVTGANALSGLGSLDFSKLGLPSLNLGNFPTLQSTGTNVLGGNNLLGGVNSNPLTAAIQNSNAALTNLFNAQKNALKVPTLPDASGLLNGQLHSLSSMFPSVPSTPANRLANVPDVINQLGQLNQLNNLLSLLPGSVTSQKRALQDDSAVTTTSATNPAVVNPLSLMQQSLNLESIVQSVKNAEQNIAKAVGLPLPEDFAPGSGTLFAQMVQRYNASLPAPVQALFQNGIDQINRLSGATANGLSPAVNFPANANVNQIFDLANKMNPLAEGQQQGGIAGALRGFQLPTDNAAQSNGNSVSPSSPSSLDLSSILAGLRGSSARSLSDTNSDSLAQLISANPNLLSAGSAAQTVSHADAVSAASDHLEDLLGLLKQGAAGEHSHAFPRVSNPSAALPAAIPGATQAASPAPLPAQIPAALPAPIPAALPAPIPAALPAPIPAALPAALSASNAIVGTSALDKAGPSAAIDNVSGSVTLSHDQAVLLAELLAHKVIDDGDKARDGNMAILTPIASGSKSITSGLFDEISNSQANANSYVGQRMGESLAGQVAAALTPILHLGKGIKDGFVSQIQDQSPEIGQAISDLQTKGGLLNRVAEQTNLPGILSSVPKGIVDSSSSNLLVNQTPTKRNLQEQTSDLQSVLSNLLSQMQQSKSVLSDLTPTASPLFANLGNSLLSSPSSTPNVTGLNINNALNSLSAVGSLAGLLPSTPITGSASPGLSSLDLFGMVDTSVSTPAPKNADIPSCAFTNTSYSGRFSYAYSNVESPRACQQQCQLFSSPVASCSPSMPCLGMTYSLVTQRCVLFFHIDKTAHSVPYSVSAPVSCGASSESFHQVSSQFTCLSLAAAQNVSATNGVKYALDSEKLAPLSPLAAPTIPSLPVVASKDPNGPEGSLWTHNPEIPASLSRVTASGILYQVGQGNNGYGSTYWESISNISDWRQCQLICNTVESCAVWTYRFDGNLYGTIKGACQLGTNTNPMANLMDIYDNFTVTTISGRRLPSEELPVDLFGTLDSSTSASHPSRSLEASFLSADASSALSDLAKQLGISASALSSSLPNLASLKSLTNLNSGLPTLAPLFVEPSSTPAGDKALSSTEASSSSSSTTAQSNGQLLNTPGRWNEPGFVYYSKLVPSDVVISAVSTSTAARAVTSLDSCRLLCQQQNIGSVIGCEGFQYFPTAAFPYATALIVESSPCTIFSSVPNRQNMMPAIPWVVSGSVLGSLPPLSVTDPAHSAIKANDLDGIMAGSCVDTNGNKNAFGAGVSIVGQLLSQSSSSNHEVRPNIYTDTLNTVSCMKMCASEPSCTGFSLTENHICYLFSSIEGYQKDPSVLSGFSICMRNGLTDWSSLIQQTTAANVDEKGSRKLETCSSIKLDVGYQSSAEQSGLGAVDAESSQDCFNSCRGTKRCSYFTFNGRDKKCSRFVSIDESRPVVKSPLDNYVSGSSQCDVSGTPIVDSAPEEYSDSKKMTKGAIAGTVVGAAAGATAIVGALGTWYSRKLSSDSSSIVDPDDQSASTPRKTHNSSRPFKSFLHLTNNSWSFARTPGVSPVTAGKTGEVDDDEDQPRDDEP